MTITFSREDRRTTEVAAFFLSSDAAMAGVSQGILAGYSRQTSVEQPAISGSSA